MQSSKPRFLKYLFVCENSRADASCCMPVGEKLRELLKSEVKTRGLAAKIRVSRSGCLDVCSEGPNVLLMPDNRWYSRVTPEDVGSILQDAMKGIV